MELVSKTLEQRYRVFRFFNDANPPHGLTVSRVENCTPDGFLSEQEAIDWIEENGDHRTLGYDYTIMLCRRVVPHYA